jgi:drug/metabolite transporter (DMT)-like permease
MRILIAGIVLVLFFTVAGFKLKWGERWRRYLVIGLLNSAIPGVLYSFAALSLPASVEAVLNALSPCFGAIFAAIWLGEPLSGRKVLGLGLGLAGVGIVSGIGRGSGGNATLVAALACVAATACYGLAGVFIKKKAKDIESRSMAAGSQLLGGLFLLPSLAFFPPSGILQPKVALITLLFALLCSAIAYLIYYRLIADVGPTKALTVTFLIPVFGFLWGGLFFGEAIDPPMLGGSVLILCGTYLVAANAKKSRLFPANPH